LGFSCCLNMLTVYQIPILAIVLGLMLKSSGIFEVIGRMHGDSVVAHLNQGQERVVEVM
jgi:hypothetical protein